jgi:mRNA-degrading endonuclease YafQ of YafQ-DinJ toxin-antitoxin module
MIEEFVWGSAFKRAFKNRFAGRADEGLFWERLAVFRQDPFDARLKTHRLAGKLEQYWAFSIAYDCRVVFRFLSDNRVLLANIGTHEEVY